MAPIRWYDYVLLCKKYDYEVNHKSQQCQPPSVKICIGYVLKSADIGTLFSNRYCILKIHPTHTLADTHALLHTPAHTSVRLRTPVHTAHPCAYTCIPTNIHVHPLLPEPKHTHTHPHAPTRTPRAPVVVVEVIVVVVDEFELINHM